MRVTEVRIAALTETALKQAYAAAKHWFSAPDMYKEAFNMRDYFLACAKIGTETDDLRAMFLRLQEEGRNFENFCPLRSAVYLLGLLCAAFAHGEARENFRDPSGICSLLGSAARMPAQAHFASLTEENAHTIGEKMFLRYGLQGVRGEAADSLSVLTLYVLPAFERDIGSMDAAEAEARAFLHLLTLVKDTSAVAALGMEKTEALSEKAKALMSDASADKIRLFGDELQALHVPLNGYISLLACAFALRSFCAVS